LIIMRTSTLILLILLILSSLAAFAREDGTLSLNPAVVMLHGDHGQSTTQTLTLRNGTSRLFSFDLIAQDVVIRDGKRVFAEPGSIAGSIAGTAVFSQKHVDVRPGESVSVDVTVTLPPATPQRAIIALFRGTNTVMNGNVPMSASLGTLLTFSDTDDQQFTASPIAARPQTASSNLAFTQSCTNSGHEPFVAKGVMAVLDARGSLIGKSELRPHRFLPGESAELGGEFPGDLKSGRYRLLVTYDYEGKTLNDSAEVNVP
jgi:hypothetical protein